MGLFLNYPIEEYIQQLIKLQEFNKKYNLNFQKDTTNINLICMKIGNEGLKDLCQLKFKELKELDLKYNKIRDINILEKVNLKKLEKLNLYHNKILDINILEKIKLKELKELNLSDNKISDIKILGKVNFKEL